MFSGLRPSASRMGPVLLRPHPVSSLLQQDFSRFSQVFPRLYPMFPGPYPVFLAFPALSVYGMFWRPPGRAPTEDTSHKVQYGELAWRRGVLVVD